MAAGDTMIGLGPSSARTVGALPPGRFLPDQRLVVQEESVEAGHPSDAHQVAGLPAHLRGGFRVDSLMDDVEQVRRVAGESRA